MRGGEGGTNKIGGEGVGEGGEGGEGGGGEGLNKCMPTFSF